MYVPGRLVAVRRLDGTVRKGWTADFKPGCDFFHVRSEDGVTVRVRTRGLKAVFFIRTVEGDPRHVEVKEFGAGRRAEKKVWVEFVDGEELAGWSTSIAPDKNGFFFTPTDPASNAERVFAFRRAVRRVLLGEQAERAAEAYRRRAHRRPSLPR